MKLRFFNFLMLIIFALVLPFFNVFAANSFKFSPPVIDLKLHQHDIASTTVNFENPSSVQLKIFVFLEDVISDQTIKHDSLNSLSGWIEMPASIDLKPNGLSSVPISIHPHPLATPGIYHTNINFVSAYSQYEAEKLKGTGRTVTINLEIVKDSVERLSLLGFNSNKSVYFSAPVTFQYSLQNVGNQPVTPVVHVRIYDNQGRETIELSPQSGGSAVDIGGELKDTLIWQNNRAFGRYKAYFVADYGASQTSNVQDTIYFWVIPWYLFVLFAIGLFTVLALTHWLYGFFNK